MKKWLSIIVVLAMMAAMLLTACGQADADQANTNGTDQDMSQEQDNQESDALYKPGTYEGEGQGHAGPIKLAVTVNENAIEKIEVVEFSDSEFAEEPRDQMIENIIAANSADVDAVAGASLTSSSVKEAAAAALALAYVNGAPEDNSAAETDEDTAPQVLEDRTTDVVVIGAGGAGLTAAIEAKNNGANVIIVEKMPIIGGNTKYATGGLNAAETSVQKELGIEDSIELFYEDTMKGGGNINNPDLVNVLTHNAKNTVEWLIGMGADLSDVGRMGGASVNRCHRPSGGAPAGNHIVEVLYAQAEKLGVEILMSTQATAIINEEGKAAGIEVESNEGIYNIHAKAVVVASGGFGANNELVAEFRPEFKGYGTTNHPGATGDVIDFASTMNVAYVDMKEIQTHPTVMPSNNYMITEAVRGNGAILVNQEGQRFVNEIDTRAVVSKAELEQTGQSAYIVFDQGVRESLSAIEGYYKKGFLLEAETPEALAELMGVDPQALAGTLASYNQYVAEGVDPDFERPDMPRDLVTGPYYAVEVAPAVHHTMGGLMINTDAQVLNTDGEAIDGLYAAGEVTGGVHGNNRLGGNALADITTFGRIAGTNAAQSIQ